MTTLHEKCPYSEFFWSSFSHIWTDYRDLLCKSLYSVRMRKNPDQKHSKYGRPLFTQCMRIWSHLLKKSFMENFIFCAIKLSHFTSQYLKFFLCYSPYSALGIDNEPCSSRNAIITIYYYSRITEISFNISLLKSAVLFT